MFWDPGETSKPEGKLPGVFLSHFVACSPLLSRMAVLFFPLHHDPDISWPWNRWTSKDRPRTTAELRPLAIDQMNFDESWWILSIRLVQNVAPNPPGPASSCNMALSRRCSSRRMDSMDVFLGHWANLGHMAMPCLCLELAPWNQVVYIMSKRGKNTFTWMGMGQTPGCIWAVMGNPIDLNFVSCGLMAGLIYYVQVWTMKWRHYLVISSGTAKECGAKVSRNLHSWKCSVRFREIWKLGS